MFKFKWYSLYATCIFTSSFRFFSTLSILSRSALHREIFKHSITKRLYVNIPITLKGSRNKIVHISIFHRTEAHKINFNGNIVEIYGKHFRGSRKGDCMCRRILSKFLSNAIKVLIVWYLLLLQKWKQ